MTSVPEDLVPSLPSEDTNHTCRQNIRTHKIKNKLKKKEVETLRFGWCQHSTEIPELEQAFTFPMFYLGGSRPVFIHVCLTALINTSREIKKG